MPVFLSLLAAILPATLAAQGARFGGAVAAADVNGDGFDDVIVGEPRYDGHFRDEGRVLVFHGSAAGPSATPAWIQRGHQTRAHFGATLAGLGDMNGDGFEDVAIGAPDFDARHRRASLEGSPPGPLRDAGLVTVFLGSPGGLASTPALFRPGIQEAEHIGAALSTAGDVDGDGFDDLLVGGTGTNGRRGVALLFAGTPAGPSSLPDWMHFGFLVDAGLGGALSGGGDVNGDGFDDVLLGVPGGGQGGRGQAYLFHGSASGLPTNVSWAVSPFGGDDFNDNGNSDWGAHVCIAGDMDGDGFDDLLIGNPTYDVVIGSHGGGDILLPDEGVVFFYSGQASTPPVHEARNSGAKGRFSAAVGNLNGGIRADVVFATSDTSVRLRYGNLTWGGATPPGASSFSGVSCAGGGIDGDGLDDLVVGDPAHLGAGIVRIYRGSTTGLGSASMWTLQSP